MRSPGRSSTGGNRTFRFLKNTPTPERMAKLQQRRGREVLYAEFRDGTRELRVGTKRSVDPPLRGDIVDMIHTQPSHGLPSQDDLNVIKIIVGMGTPLRELKVVAPDGTLFIHYLDNRGRPLRGPRGRLQIIVVRPN
jgi:hypothetical protein